MGLTKEEIDEAIKKIDEATKKTEEEELAEYVKNIDNVYAENNSKKLRKNLQDYWTESDKSDSVLNNIINGNIFINDYKFYVQTIGNRVFIHAKKNNDIYIIFDLGDPDNSNDGILILKSKLNDTNIGGKRRSYRNRKSKKLRKCKSIKNRRKSIKNRRKSIVAVSK